jgi:hypothetical protein
MTMAKKINAVDYSTMTQSELETRTREVNEMIVSGKLPSGLLVTKTRLNQLQREATDITLELAKREMVAEKVKSPTASDKSYRITEIEKEIVQNGVNQELFNEAMTLFDELVIVDGKSRARKDFEVWYQKLEKKHMSKKSKVIDNTVVATTELVQEELTSDTPFTLIPSTDEKEVALSSLIDLEHTPVKNAKYAMREIKDEHTEHLYLAIKSGAVMPPLKVVASSLGNILLDGYHRRAAYTRIATEEKADPSKVSVTVSFLPIEKDRQLMKAAFEANRTNGLPLSNGSRSRYAIWLLELAKEDGEKLSLREAARIAQVSHVAVIKQLQRVADKQDKMVDEFLQDEEDIAETEDALIEEADKKTDDALPQARKTLRAALLKMARFSDNASELQRYLSETLELDKLDEVERERVSIVVQTLSSII